MDNKPVINDKVITETLRHFWWAIEIKRSLTPKVERGFHSACADLMPAKKIIVYPGVERYPVSHDIEVISLTDLARLVLQAHQGQ